MNVNCENDTQQVLKMEARGIHAPDIMEVSDNPNKSTLKEGSSPSQIAVDKRGN